MKSAAAPSKSGFAPASVAKSPTGIAGLDEITGGGLPTGRPTLICGTAGAGKTMLATEFLVRGATQYGEPGVLVMFEETAQEITDNVRSLGFDMDTLVAEKKILLDHVHVERSEIEETGEYDLEGLFIRLGYAIDSIGAKRIALDTLEALFAGFSNHGVLRAELRRLFRWLKERGMTAIITGERGDASLTRYGLEEYVADCVIVLDHRVNEQISTRRLRVVKYRGSAHGTNEYPFLIGETGMSVLPVTSLTLDHSVSTEVISSGVPSLDGMLGAGGFFRGSSVLISGAAGSGKSSLGASFAAEACQRGERAIIFAFEESREQIARNMRSIGIELAPYLDQGLLEIRAARPTLQGLEQHLVMMHDAILKFKPSLVVIDPISNLTFDTESKEVKPTMIRLIDLLKQEQITGVFLCLTSGGSASILENTEVGVSSLMDSWILLRNLEADGERNRTLFVLKSRGMSHSNQIREFVLSSEGIDLVEVYLGNDRVLTGTARMSQASRERAETERLRLENERAKRLAATRRRALEAKIAALHAELEADAIESEAHIQEYDAGIAAAGRDAELIAQSRAQGRDGNHSSLSHSKKTKRS